MEQTLNREDQEVELAMREKLYRPGLVCQHCREPIVAIDDARAIEVMGRGWTLVLTGCAAEAAITLVRPKLLGRRRVRRWD